MNMLRPETKKSVLLISGSFGGSFFLSSTSEVFINVSMHPVSPGKPWPPWLRQSAVYLF